MKRERETKEDKKGGDKEIQIEKGEGGKEGHFLNMLKNRTDKIWIVGFGVLVQRTDNTTVTTKH